MKYNMVVLFLTYRISCILSTPKSKNEIIPRGLFGLLSIISEDLEKHKEFTDIYATSASSVLKPSAFIYTTVYHSIL